MELISRVSKGSRMDQVYIPKNRVGIAVGSYVVVKQIEVTIETEKLNFYNVGELEPVKVGIIPQIFKVIKMNADRCENIIVTGSFLEKGFFFNDIDIVLVAGEHIDEKRIGSLIEDATGIKTHIIAISNAALIEGLATDPLYSVMLSRCVASKKFIYHAERRVDYKLLDLHLLKSKTLIDNFDVLNGSEKYDLVRNLAAIDLFLNGKKVSHDTIVREIKDKLGVSVKEIKQNTLEKKEFVKKYSLLYKKTFEVILRGIERDSKQKKTD